jgi:hypothetical protein
VVGISEPLRLKFVELWHEIQDWWFAFQREVL